MTEINSCDADNALKIFDAIIDHAHEPNVREMSHAEMIESAIAQGEHYYRCISTAEAHLIADALIKWRDADNGNDAWYVRDDLREAVESGPCSATATVHAV